MHLVIAFAAPPPDAAAQALDGLRLPRLAALLAAARPLARDEGDAWSLSPPHERALARVFGWSGGDGCLPLAAWQAQRDGVDTGDLAWGQVTPVHWQVGAEDVRLFDTDILELDAASARALFEAVHALFASEGFVLCQGTPTRWYLAHESLAQLSCASLDRAAGRSVQRWLEAGREARLWRRLQNEVQMVWHTHPVNAEREARGALVVNSVWLDGCGVAQPCRGEAAIELRLRGPALAGDWQAWQRAWAAIDAELGSRRPEQITLCGERSAATFALQCGWPQRVRGWLRRADPAEQLGGL